MKTVLLMVCSVLLLAGSASAIVIYEESFDYQAGAIGGQGAWVDGPTAVHGAIVVNPVGLTYPGIGASGGCAEAVLPYEAGQQVAQDYSMSAAFDAAMAADGVVYFTYLYQMGPKPNHGGLSWYPGGWGPGTINYGGSSVGNRYMAVDHDNGEPMANLGFPIGFGVQTELIVARHTLSTTGEDTIDLLLNPVLTGDEATDFATPTATLISDFEGYTDYFLTMSSSHHFGQWYIDEIRVATTYGEALPEPTTLAVLGLGGLVALLRRRR